MWCGWQAMIIFHPYSFLIWNNWLRSLIELSGYSSSLGRLYVDILNALFPQSTVPLWQWEPEWCSGEPGAGARGFLVRDEQVRGRRLDVEPTHWAGEYPLPVHQGCNTPAGTQANKPQVGAQEVAACWLGILANTWNHCPCNVNITKNRLLFLTHCRLVQQKYLNESWHLVHIWILVLRTCLIGNNITVNIYIHVRALLVSFLRFSW